MASPASATEGGISNAAALASPELAAAGPFYGRQAHVADVPRIRAPLLLQYAERDGNVHAGWPDYEAALKAGGKTYEAHVNPAPNTVSTTISPPPI